MGTRFRFLAGIVVPVLLVGLSACNNSSSSSSAGTGAVFVASQGDSSVTSFSVDLSTGLLTAGPPKASCAACWFGCWRNSMATTSPL